MKELTDTCSHLCHPSLALLYYIYRTFTQQQSLGLSCKAMDSQGAWYHYCHADSCHENDWRGVATGFTHLQAAKQECTVTMCIASR